MELLSKNLLGVKYHSSREIIYSETHNCNAEFQKVVVR